MGRIGVIGAVGRALRALINGEGGEGRFGSELAAWSGGGGGRQDVGLEERDAQGAMCGLSTLPC